MDWDLLPVTGFCDAVEGVSSDKPLSSLGFDVFLSASTNTAPMIQLICPPCVLMVSKDAMSIRINRIVQDFPLFLRLFMNQFSVFKFLLKPAMVLRMKEFGFLVGSEITTRAFLCSGETGGGASWGKTIRLELIVGIPSFTALRSHCAQEKSKQGV